MLVMESRDLTLLMASQVGTVSRRQVLALGHDDSCVARRLRCKDWARVHIGVYVDLTGELTWMQRAWAAVLFYWPAALCNESSLRAFGLRTTGNSDLVHVAVEQRRRVSKLPGVRLHRVSSLGTMVQANLSPARVSLERSLLDVAGAARDEATAIAVLGDACQCGRTTPARLLALLSSRTKLPQRRFLREVLDDVAGGVYSVLEHRYLTRVERPHGLPTAQRQRRVNPGRSAAYRDVEYLTLRTVVELDGRLGHEETLDRWRDMDRDIDAAAAGDMTLRVGWQHVLDPCRTAQAIGRVLTARGWTGELTPCSSTCSTGVLGDVPARRAGRSPRTA
jgi:hypothetical protein